MKPLPGKFFDVSNRAELKFNRWYMEINPAEMPIAWLFNPQCWVNAPATWRKGDIVRVVASDGSYDFELKIAGRTIGGRLAVRVSIYSGFGDNLPQYVRDAEKAVFATAMLPSSVNGKPVPRVEFVEADRWRLVGFGNDVVSRSHETEAAAQLAMAEYINVYGFTSIADVPEKTVADAPTRNGETQLEPAQKVDPALNMDFQRRKDADHKAKRDAQRKLDAEQLAAMQAAKATQ